MVNNEALNTMTGCILDGQLGKAIRQLDNYLYTFVHAPHREQLEQIKADYLLMTEYWQNGYEDPHREELYRQLLRRMYVLTTNIYIRYYIRNSSYVMGVYGRARNSRSDWSAAALRSDMESFVSDVAMLELEPEHKRAQKQQEVYGRHEQMMADLFDYIWTSRLWSDGVTAAFEEMLLSPTIDSNDQQLMVSAIMLSALNFFGFNKFRLLMSVYMKTADERVRQRALIGWVLCLRPDVGRLYPEVQDMVRQAAEDERCRNELTELQMQMEYCLQAERDTRKIQSEIMPDLLKNNNLRVTRNGLEEVEEDPMEDVLSPELSEQRMERLEASMQKMIDMQKQGSDIYFGGFSQMKRFPFFDRIGNWFVPFYPQHTAVNSILGRVRGKIFLQKMLTEGPFCDSDKYSFAIAYERTVSQLPETMLEMMDKGEATIVGTDLENSGFDTPAFYRRSYLQNIYRFFKVFPARGNFYNPIEEQGTLRFHFFANPLFRGTALESRFVEVVSFLMKHGAYEAAKATLENCSGDSRDAQFFLLNGTLLMRSHEQSCAGFTARESFARCLEMDADNERAWAGYARASFNEGDYEEAQAYYRKLLANHEDSHSYQLNVAVCLTNLNDYEEALKILYKLNYESPDNQQVNRVLAWALTGSHKYEQALKIYDGLLSVDKPEADDLLNVAYCNWFNRRVGQAVQLFRRYAKQDDIRFDAAKEFLEHEADMIAGHGVSRIEVQLMIDLLV
ncbi:MAG: tetratricopeptide repeat protein [Prevotella sp.]|nr:tetratricopeptide repeat protein [Prevotella sp.]